MPVFYLILRGVSIGREIIVGLEIKGKIISSFSGKMMYNDILYCLLDQPLCG
jgi:hypothetical protein